MKIVSLLPSATEIVYALGLGDELCGRSFECDYPDAAATVPIVSGTALATNDAPSAAEIDAQVSARVAAGESIYTLDDARIRAIAPDLILAQDLCAVCAVPSGAVEDALDVIGCRADVLSLDPKRLAEVIDCIGAVGAATGTEARAEELMGALRARVDAVRVMTSGLTRPKVLLLEWADPPFSAGHWMPDMIDAAGGEPVLAHAGARSVRLEWRDVATAGAEIVVFAPCGYDLAGAVAQAGTLLARPELDDVERVVAVDANAMFSRPGPRIVDGVELLAHVLRPGELPSSREGAPQAFEVVGELGRARQER